MKVLLVNGSPNEHGCTYTALNEVEKTLNKNGVETVMMWLGKGDVPDCIGCKSCAKTGRCFVDDKVNEAVSMLPELDGIVVGSPVYYAGPTGQITSFMDRLFYVGSGFDGKLGACVVSCRRGGASAAFDRLNKYFMISCMPVVTSQYWNQVHGAFGKGEDVLKDEEGLQTMRTLGNQMAWLLKCIEAGKANGISVPEREKPIKTAFIR